MDAWDTLLFMAFVVIPALVWMGLVAAIMGIGRLRGRKVGFGAANAWVFGLLTALCILGLILA